MSMKAQEVATVCFSFVVSVVGCSLTSSFFCGFFVCGVPTLFPESVCEGFFVKKHLQNYVSSTSSPPHIHILTYISAHLHIYIHNCTSTSLHIFTASHRHLCSSSSSHTYISAHVHICTSTSLLIFTSSHLHLTSLPLIYISHLHLSPGAAPPDRHETQPSAEIVRVEGAKCRRECDLSRSRATLCGDRVKCAKCRREAQPSAEIVRVEDAKRRRECDLFLSGATFCRDRACGMREMPAGVRFGFVRRNLLQRSCVSNARNAGRSAICPGRGQPSAEIVRVEGAKCRRECDLSRSGATLCGDRACRLCSTRNFSTRSNLWSWKLRTGDFVVQLESAEYLGSWKMRTGDFLVQL